MADSPIVLNECLKIPEYDSVMFEQHIIDTNKKASNGYMYPVEGLRNFYKPILPA